eukprot:357833-Chlamydomonas_euryale.AAC.11
MPEAGIHAGGRRPAHAKAAHAHEVAHAHESKGAKEHTAASCDHGPAQGRAPTAWQTAGRFACE